MAGNTFGEIFRFTSFGESHGSAVGGVIDGCPAGLLVDFDAAAEDMSRRRPGQSSLTTQRSETDQIEWLSGIFEGRTTGSPIGFVIRNGDQKSEDYDQLRNVYRPSHADFAYDSKYGHRDHRGGGRSSARETATRVAAGAIAKQLLASIGVEIQAFVTAVGTASMGRELTDSDFGKAENELRCPDEETAAAMRKLIEKAQAEGDTLGGIITCRARKVPAGLGEPVFDKLHADLGKAMLSINAVKGFEIGSGFAGTQLPGSVHNDAFENQDGKIATKTNHSGGIQGGISNGMDICFSVAFKPVASISKNQETVDKDGVSTDISIKGRHDPCVLPRAVAIVEAMAALVLADHWLRNKTARL